MKSEMPPVENGTTILTGCDGYAPFACAAVLNARTAAAMMFLSMTSSLCVGPSRWVVCTRHAMRSRRGLERGFLHRIRYLANDRRAAPSSNPPSRGAPAARTVAEQSNFEIRRIAVHASPCREAEASLFPVHSCACAPLARWHRTCKTRGMAQGGPSGGPKPADVFHRLRVDIISARLRPGEKLALRKLTPSYRCGVTPLREALCQLAGSGLVMLESQRGFRVAPVSAADLEHVVAVRRHLELYAADLAVARSEDGWRRRLEQSAGRGSRVAAKAGDQRPIDEEWDRIHRNFHFCLTDARSSPAMLQLFEQLYDKFDRYRRIAIPIQAYMAVPP